MKGKTTLLIIGIFIFSLSASAGGKCEVGKGKCTVDNTATKHQTIETAELEKATGAGQENENLTIEYELDIAPIYSTPAGQTYGRWAAEWWQWSFGIPEAVNPLLDMTGVNCNRRQVGKVWFLAGAFTPDPVVRNCTIPRGKSLFFPLINISYGAFLNDPSEIRTEEYVRSIGSCTEPATIFAWIDGNRVQHPTRYFTGVSGSQSPIFNIQMPSSNLLGVTEADAPELVLSPSAEQGYYLFVEPLQRGNHTIRWIASGCTAGASQDITYRLTVVGN